jgi:molybdopterin-guanine dinucleotide biosynthesis protein A
VRSAAILVGGRASRFDGRDKAALVVDGRTIRERQVAMLSAVPDIGEILFVGGNGSIADRVPGCGPMSGLHAALSEARGEHVFVVACDMPFVTAPFVSFLFDAIGSADAVVPRGADGLHPLCAVYARKCLETVTQRLAQQQWALRNLVEAIDARTVAVEELDRFGDHRRLLANVNTPSDYAALETLQGHSR